MSFTFTNHEDYIKVIKKDWRNIQFIENQTIDLCELAIRTSAQAIRFIKNKTDELCLLAVKMSPETIEFVENQTDEICFAFIEGIDDEEDFHYWIKKPTPEMYEALYKKFGN